MYPTGCVPPKVYGLPKIYKPDTLLRPIVSSCGSGRSVTYGVAKKNLPRFLNPWLANPHTISTAPMALWNRSSSSP